MVLLDDSAETRRLALRPATVETATADLEDSARLGGLLEAEVPPSWPPELYDDDAKRWTLRGARDDGEGLLTLYALQKREGREPLLIGTGGFKGTAKNGVCEIGYALVPEIHGQGLGTELAAALTAYAFLRFGAHTVCAHTLENLVPSQRVLEKTGFVRRGTPSEDGAIRYEIALAEWRSRTSRASATISGIRSAGETISHKFPHARI